MVLQRSVFHRFSQSLANSTARYYFVGGKGGVGKTTTAAALASHFSRTHKTLVVSTDPAHSLADAFQTRLNATPLKLCDERELWGMEIDPNRSLAAVKAEMNIDKIKKKIDNKEAGFGVGMLGFLDQLGVDIKVFHQLLDMSPPGVDEAIAVSQLVSYDDSDFTKIVIDTAPTGHTLRLLNFPKFLLVSFPVLGFLTRYAAPGGIVGGAMAKMLGVNELMNYIENTEKKILELQKNMESLNSKLTDPTLTEFIVVSMPTRLAVDETKRLHRTLSEYNIASPYLVVNQMPPDPLSSKVMDTLRYLEEGEEDANVRESYRQLREQCDRQEKLHGKAVAYLAELEDALKDIETLKVPTFTANVTGLDGLEIYEKSLLKKV